MRGRDVDFEVHTTRQRRSSSGRTLPCISEANEASLHAYSSIQPARLAQWQSTALVKQRHRIVTSSGHQHGGEGLQPRVHPPLQRRKFMRGWRNRQTRCVQTAVGETPWEFNSPVSHQDKPGWRNGRRRRLKSALGRKARAGSTPAPGTKFTLPAPDGKASVLHTDMTRLDPGRGYQNSADTGAARRHPRQVTALDCRPRCMPWHATSENDVGGSHHFARA